MNKSLIVERSHQIIFKHPNKNFAIDATCGNGHDTLFLASNFAQVLAIDIQELALKRTSDKICEYRNVNLLKADFNDLTKLVSEKADVIIFNLGFLPGSNKKILTHDYKSDEAVLKAYSLLNNQGILLIACYLQHLGGIEEYKKILHSLEVNQINYQTEGFNQNHEMLIIIEKKINN